MDGAGLVFDYAMTEFGPNLGYVRDVGMGCSLPGPAVALHRGLVVGGARTGPEAYSFPINNPEDRNIVKSCVCDEAAGG